MRKAKEGLSWPNTESYFLNLGMIIIWHTINLLLKSVLCISVVHSFITVSNLYPLNTSSSLYICCFIKRDKYKCLKQHISLSFSVSLCMFLDHIPKCSSIAPDFMPRHIVLGRAWENIECPRSNWCWPHSKQIPSLLYYLLNPTHTFFISLILR